MRLPLLTVLVVVAVNSKNVPREGCSTDICAVNDWPTQSTLDLLGQVSGIDVAPDGDPVIFHRGDRVWDMNSFDQDDNYTGPDYPIAADTIIKVDGGTGEKVASSCSGKFYMPHMLTVDSTGALWVTDVALHQVFRIKFDDGACDVDLALGDPFVNGDDDEHFCKPTAVAVSADTGTFYVADGYCNHRVIKYELTTYDDGRPSQATKVWQSGQAGFATSSPLAFNIPHALALSESLGLICVADREHGRVQCLNVDDGSFVRSIQVDPVAGPAANVYGIDYALVEGQHRLYAVMGTTLNGQIPATGRTFDLETGKAVDGADFGSAEKGGFDDGLGFQGPHDLAVSSGGGFLYETELSQPFRVYKLEDTTVSEDDGEGGGGGNGSRGIAGDTILVSMLAARSLNRLT